jgi:hypothetical protein
VRCTCGAGYESQPLSANSTVIKCNPCKVGRYRSVTMGTCQPCPLGELSLYGVALRNLVFKTEHAACRPLTYCIVLCCCDQGFCWQALMPVIICYPYHSSTARWSFSVTGMCCRCTRLCAGQYTNTTGAALCTPCPAGTFGNITGGACLVVIDSLNFVERKLEVCSVLTWPRAHPAMSNTPSLEPREASQKDALLLASTH